jgi:methyl-accepting chemotaxis protein
MDMSRKGGTHRRKTYFIKKDFQFKFILTFCAVMLGGVIISTALLFFFSQDTLTSSFTHSRLVIRSTGSAILPAVIYTNLIILGLISLATIFVTLMISHKIAGPLFRFEKELTDIGGGNLTRKIYLRKEDQMGAMADGLNSMVETLHGKMVEIRDGIAEVKEIAIARNAPDVLIGQVTLVEKRIEENFVL